MTNELYAKLTVAVNDTFNNYDDDRTLANELNRVCFQVGGVTYEKYQEAARIQVFAGWGV